MGYHTTAIAQEVAYAYIGKIKLFFVVVLAFSLLGYLVGGAFFYLVLV